MNLLLVGPSKRIEDHDIDYYSQKKQEDYEIVSYSGSLPYLHEIGFAPDYYCFFDPFTLGLQYYLYKNDPEYFKNINLLIHNLYASDFKIYHRMGFTSRKLTNKVALCKKVFDLIDNFDKYYNRVYKHPSTKIDIHRSPGQLTIDQHDNRYKIEEQCYLFTGAIKGRGSSGKTVNPDKFTHVLLPLVLNHFQVPGSPGIDKIHCVGFGDFDIGRFGKAYPMHNTEGYEEYKTTFKSMVGFYRNYFRSRDIEISFENPNFYSSHLHQL